MNSTSSTRKLVNVLAAFATLCVAAFALAVAFDAHALALFGLAASALTVLIASADYTSRLSYSAAPSATILRFTPPAPRQPRAARLAA